MKNQLTTARTANSIVRAALAAGVLMILSGSLDQLSGQAARLLGVTAVETLALLPSLVLAGWQGIASNVCDHSEFSQLALKVLVSSWSLLQATACAA